MAWSPKFLGNLRTLSLKGVIFHTFRKTDFRARFLFIELDTSNSGYLLIMGKNNLGYFLPSIKSAMKTNCCFQRFFSLSFNFSPRCTSASNSKTWPREFSGTSFNYITSQGSKYLVSHLHYKMGWNHFQSTSSSP